MNFKLKSLLFSTVGASLFACLVANPAYAILLSALNGTGATVPTGGDFTFSNFVITDTPSPTSTTLADFESFDVTGSLDGLGNPILTFLNTGTLLTVSGDYTFTYQVNYTGVGSVNFLSYVQGFCAAPFDCDGDTITTNVYETASDRTALTNSQAFAQTDINQPNVGDSIQKSGGISTAYARTNINVGSGGFTGFDSTYQAVPWETDVLPLVGATILFGGGMWWKRRRAASQIDLTGQGPEQEPGQE